MAQGLAQKSFSNGFEIFSAGINAIEGDTVSEHAAAVLKEKGIDISNHLAVKLTKEMLKYADYIFTMTDSQTIYLKKSYPEYGNKIKTLGSWVGCGKEVSDPWGGSIDRYRCCAQELEQMLITAYKKLSNQGEEK